MAAAAAPAHFETGFFSSPSDLKTAGDAVDALINNIDNAIDGNEEVPQAQWDGFQVFLGDWKHFYSSNFGSLLTVTGSWLTTDLQAQLVSFQEQAAIWGHQMEKYGAEIPGGVTEPADNSLPKLPDIGISWVLVLVLIAAIIIVPRVLK